MARWPSLGDIPDPYQESRKFFSAGRLFDLPVFVYWRQFPKVKRKLECGDFLDTLKVGWESTAVGYRAHHPYLFPPTWI